MALTHQDTSVNQLIINKCTLEEYNAMSSHSSTELYIVPEEVDSVVTQESTNPVQSGAVYEALQEIGGTINDGTTIFAKNQEIIGTTSANQSANQTITLPNDVVMCKILENRALASYATSITRFKYIEDHGWVDMDRSDIQYNEGTGEWTGTFVSLDITEGEYYYDMDNNAVFVADENSEMQDVTSTVLIRDDINKLYCDVDTNILYRYNGSNFIALTSNFSGSYNDLSNKPLSIENSKVKYTLSDGTTKLTLAQESDLKIVAFTGSYKDLTDKLQNATTTDAGLMSASDKKISVAHNIMYSYNTDGLQPGLTDEFLQSFIAYVKQNFPGLVVMGQLQPDVTGCVYGFCYENANYSIYHYIGINNAILFGEKNGIYFKSTITTS